MSIINAAASFRLGRNENFKNKISLIPYKEKFKALVFLYMKLSKKSHGAVGLVKILNKCLGCL